MIRRLANSQYSHHSYLLTCARYEGIWNSKTKPSFLQPQFFPNFSHTRDFSIDSRLRHIVSTAREAVEFTKSISNIRESTSRKEVPTISPQSHLHTHQNSSGSSPPFSPPLPPHRPVFISSSPPFPLPPLPPLPPSPSIKMMSFWSVPSAMIPFIRKELGNIDPVDVSASLLALQRYQNKTRNKEKLPGVAAMKNTHLDTILLRDAYRCMRFSAACYGFMGQAYLFLTDPSSSFTATMSNVGSTLRSRVFKGEDAAFLDLSGISAAKAPISSSSSSSSSTEYLLHSSLDARIGIPKHFVVVDAEKKKVIVAIRGTMSLVDALTDALARRVEFCGGEAHEGIAHAARSVYASTRPVIEEELAKKQKEKMEKKNEKNGVNTSKEKQLQLTTQTVGEESKGTATATTTATTSDDMLQQQQQQHRHTAMEKDEGDENGWTLELTGHSLGASTAILYTILVHHERQQFLESRKNNGSSSSSSSSLSYPFPLVTKIVCNSFAPAPVFTPIDILPKHTTECIRSYVSGEDLIPRLTVEALKDVVDICRNISTQYPSWSNRVFKNVELDALLEKKRAKTLPADRGKCNDVSVVGANESDHKDIDKDVSVINSETTTATNTTTTTTTTTTTDDTNFVSVTRDEALAVMSAAEVCEQQETLEQIISASSSLSPTLTAGESVVPAAETTETTATTMWSTGAGALPLPAPTGLRSMTGQNSSSLSLSSDVDSSVDSSGKSGGSRFQIPGTIYNFRPPVEENSEGEEVEATPSHSLGLKVDTNLPVQTTTTSPSSSSSSSKSTTTSTTPAASPSSSSTSTITTAISSPLSAISEGVVSAVTAVSTVFTDISSLLGRKNNNITHLPTNTSSSPSSSSSSSTSSSTTTATTTIPKSMVSSRFLRASAPSTSLSSSSPPSYSSYSSPQEVQDEANKRADQETTLPFVTYVSPGDLRDLPVTDKSWLDHMPDQYLYGIRQLLEVAERQEERRNGREKKKE